jgi:plasmid maintenance system killer protein
MCKKQFAFGHQGKGTLCHHCEQKNKHSQQAFSLEDFYNLKLDLNKVPKEFFPKTWKMIQILIKNGFDYRVLKGKRLRCDRTLISIRINYQYRLICKDVNGQIIPIAVLAVPKEKFLI